MKVIKPEDVKGKYDLTIDLEGTEPIGNLCHFCGRCAECEHPFWECPKLTELKEYAKV